MVKNGGSDFQERRGQNSIKRTPTLKGNTTENTQDAPVIEYRNTRCGTAETVSETIGEMCGSQITITERYVAHSLESLRLDYQTHRVRELLTNKIYFFLKRQK